MRRGLVFLGGAGFAFATMVASAEAKLVRYEIDGQTYSYSTNNRQQVEEARQRIAAARAAAAARAKADAELASNPLVAIFGSQAQADAKEAQARFGQAVAHPEQSAARSTSSIEPTRTVRQREKSRPERLVRREPPQKLAQPKRVEQARASVRDPVATA